MRAAAEVYVFPLSPAQERIWLADERRPGNPAYNASFRWSLQGPLNITVLERSFNEIVRRHEILRATFARVNENPAQIIAPVLLLRISVMDLRSLPIDEREREIDRLCGEEATRSFDLKKGPLIRVGLLRAHDQQHVLMLTLHHIVCDGWSISLIMEELQKIYGAFASGQPSPLPELPIQYSDYVVWQREHNTDAALAPQLAYWQRKLESYRRLEVKTDFPRTAEYAIHGAIVSEILPRDLTDALKKFSDQHGGTLFITALAACMVLLHHYTGETDIAVGSPLAGRNQTEVEGLIGLFVNHVIFRVVMPSDPTFFELDVLSVTKFKDMDDAIAIGNDTPYGLGAGVWSRSGSTVYRVGREIQAGRVWTNCYHVYPAGAAFGGYKQSGFGRETHKMILDHYQQTKNLLVSYIPKALGFF